MIEFAGSVRSLVASANKALDEGSIDSALRIAHDFVERVVTEPLFTSQVFASKSLDDLCLRIGRVNLESFVGKQRAPLQFSHSHGRPRVAYIVSRLQRSGGHLRLILDFIRSQPEKDHFVFSTGVAGPSDKFFFEQSLQGAATVFFFVAPRGDFAARLTWLQNSLLGCAPEHIFLFNHHQDSVAVAALPPELGFPGSFCHHGDHHLCLGVHLDHLTHIDFHPMGFHYCRNELGVESQYLPLTFEDKGVLREKIGFAEKPGVTSATVARSNKVEIPYYVNYVDLIPQVIKVTGGRHVHIGKLTPWAIRRMRSNMDALGIPQDRLVYIDWTSSVWESLQKFNVDVYIASFPYGAGLTLIEVMGAGIPVIMHRHVYSRVLSGLELAYPEAFNWDDPDRLLDHLANLNCDDLRHEGGVARMWYETYHRPEILKLFLSAPSEFQLPVPSLVSNFRQRSDEWAAWAEAQMNVPRMLYRSLYRLGRRLRTYLS